MASSSFSPGTFFERSAATIPITALPIIRKITLIFKKVARAKTQIIISNDSTLSIELQDSVENIFKRLVFSDENDVIYKDDEYKNEHKDYYMEDIIEDQKWYGSIYASFCHSFDMNGDSPEESARRIISEFNITSER